MNTDTTKVYVVTKSRGCFSYTSNSPVMAFLSRRDAEFWVWQKENEPKSESMRYMYGYNSYSVYEVEVGSVEKDPKQYKKFATEKLAEIEKSIKEKEDCAEKDTEAIKKLNEEKSSYLN